MYVYIRAAPSETQYDKDKVSKTLSELRQIVKYQKKPVINITHHSTVRGVI